LADSIQKQREGIEHAGAHRGVEPGDEALYIIDLGCSLVIEGEEQHRELRGESPVRQRDEGLEARGLDAAFEVGEVLLGEAAAGGELLLGEPGALAERADPLAQAALEIPKVAAHVPIVALCAQCRNRPIAVTVA
jgi:hypothetical protein